MKQQKKKILIIDDEVDLSDLLKVRLELSDYYVIPLYTSRRALEIVKREKPDLILLDIMMPDIDGYGVLTDLKKDPEARTIPVILFSAVGDEQKKLLEKCIELGADDFIFKPFNPQELMLKIKLSCIKNAK